MPDAITKLTYQTFQQGKSSFALGHKTLTSRLKNLIFPPSKPQNNSWSPGLVLKIQQRMQKLLDADWEDSEKGIYPVEILFDNPWEDFFSYYPMMCLDRLSSWERIQKRKYQVFSSEIDTKDYPRYYLQNFHHQNVKRSPKKLPIKVRNLAENYLSNLIFFCRSNFCFSWVVNTMANLFSETPSF